MLCAWTGHYAVNRAYGTNGLNQYAYAGPASFSYDANGNLMWDGGGGRGFVYDIENRLAGTSEGVSTPTATSSPTAPAPTAMTSRTG